MIWGVLQQLRIAKQETGLLILREQPIFEYLIIMTLLLGAVNMALFSLWVTAAGAIIIALVLANLSRMRELRFDGTQDAVRIYYRYLLRAQLVNEILLADIQRAYLRKDDNDYTQIILVTTQGELGLSVYSRDMRPWKETIVIAINAFLHDVRDKTAQMVIDAPLPPDDEADGND